MTDLLKFVQSFTNISEKSWKILLSITTTVEFRKGEYLVHPDKVCHSLYYISKGYCRSFYMQDGEEINTNFYFENEIATHINGYVNSQKSSLAIQACEPLTAYQFDKIKVFEISKLAPELEMIGKKNVELIAAKQEKQLELYRLLSAKQRYEYLEKNEPEFLQRVPLSQLSSYLGVARETLSRIRKNRLK